MICSRFHCARTVAVLIDKSSERGEDMGLGTPCDPLPGFDAVQGEERAHACNGDVGIAQQARSIGELEQLDEMEQAACALLAADHGEMPLMAVEPRQEDDTGLVEARRRLEHVAR